jgi:multidrug efflux pump
MVPLSSVVTSHYVTGPDLMTRFNNFPAVKITANPAPGYSSGQAIAALERIGAQVLPPDMGLAWSGEAFEAQKAGNTSTAVFAFGLIMVFLILAAQYEKWSLPIGVLMAVPFALFGSLLAIMLRGLNNDVYFQIGLTMLVALAAKNAILIFEFAVLNRDQGKSFYDAAMIAAKERLRPIVMTSIAFILGCVPLAIAKGASANSRQSIGTGVIGGMLAATVIAVFFIPMFYYVIEKGVARFGKSSPGAPAETPPQPEAAGPAHPHSGGLAGQLPHAKHEGE